MFNLLCNTTVKRDIVIKKQCARAPQPRKKPDYRSTRSKWESLSEEEKYRFFTESTQEHDQKILEIEKRYCEREIERMQREHSERMANERRELIEAAVEEIVAHDIQIKRLEKKLEKYQNRLELFTCKICFEKRIGVLFLPCHHFSSCEDCSKLLQDCPMCRTRIASKNKVYL